MKVQDDGRVTADAATGLSQAEPQSTQGLDPSGFDPSRTGAAAYNARYRAVHGEEPGDWESLVFGGAPS